MVNILRVWAALNHLCKPSQPSILHFHHFRAGYKLQCYRKALRLPATLLATSQDPINSTESDSVHGRYWHKQPSVGVSRWHDSRHRGADCTVWAWGVPCDLEPTVGPTVSPAAVPCQHFTQWIICRQENGENELALPLGLNWDSSGETTLFMATLIIHEIKSQNCLTIIIMEPLFK